jgi:hypothetical protein
MGKYIVAITSDDDEPQNILVSIPVIGQNTWRTLNTGVWRYNSGACYILNRTDTAGLLEPSARTINPHKHLVLCNTPFVSAAAGVQLYDFKGWTMINDAGVGILANNWSLSSVVKYLFHWQLVE